MLEDFLRERFGRGDSGEVGGGDAPVYVEEEDE